MIPKSVALRLVLSVLALVGVYILGSVAFHHLQVRKLTAHHATEFAISIQTDIEKGCLLDLPSVLRVLEYSKDKAVVFGRAPDGSSFIMRFSRQRQGGWSMINSGVCHYEVLKSNSGGSADSLIFPWFY